MDTFSRFILTVFGKVRRMDPDRGCLAAVVLRRGRGLAGKAVIVDEDIHKILDRFHRNNN